MDFDNKTKGKNKVYNNIIYYDENQNHLKSKYDDCDYFEKNTPGAFFYAKVLVL